MLKSSLIVFGIVFLSQPCVAAGLSGYRSIQSIGCHRSDGTCYIDIDGPAVTGGSGCTSNSVRWDSKNDTNGKNWLALVMLAKSLNKKINLNIDGCYSPQPSYPTFTFGVIEP